MLAHEVRNPLASLELFAGWLLESRLTGEQREWLQYMQAGIRTLDATVHNVLHWHSPCPVNLVSLDFGQWLDQVAGFLSPAAQQAGVQVSLNNHLHGIMAAADPHALRQMALNIALNAYRAMPNGGTLHLYGSVGVENAADGEISLEFQDSGAGIAPENLTKIFRGGFSTMSGSPGLGLAVCRTIVERHGGHLSVRNVDTGGACFRVQLPMIPLLT
jgi:signal transduction histidine kinase